MWNACELMPHIKYLFTSINWPWIIFGTNGKLTNLANFTTYSCQVQSSFLKVLQNDKFGWSTRGDLYHETLWLCCYQHAAGHHSVLNNTIRHKILDFWTATIWNLLLITKSMVYKYSSLSKTKFFKTMYLQPLSSYTLKG